MTAARIPALERRWAEMLAPVSLDLRLAAMLELARAGVLAAVGLDLRTASMMATDVSAPGAWRRAEEIVGLSEAASGAPPDDGWSAWTRFCARSEPIEIKDYRSLLDERYER